MKNMNELREERFKIEQEMLETAKTNEAVIRGRIENFLSILEDELGLHTINYEIFCYWEDPAAETDTIGFDPIIISSE